MDHVSLFHGDTVYHPDLVFLQNNVVFLEAPKAGLGIQTHFEKVWQFWESLAMMNQHAIHNPSIDTYCWWTKSCTSWYGKYPIIFRVLTIPGGAGFRPSTVFHNHPISTSRPNTASRSQHHLQVSHPPYCFISVCQNRVTWHRNTPKMAGGPSRIGRVRGSIGHLFAEALCEVHDPFLETSDIVDGKPHQRVTPLYHDKEWYHGVELKIVGMVHFRQIMYHSHSRVLALQFFP